MPSRRTAIDLFANRAARRCRTQDGRAAEGQPAQHTGRVGRRAAEVLALGLRRSRPAPGSSVLCHGGLATTSSPTPRSSRGTRRAHAGAGSPLRRRGGPRTDSVSSMAANTRFRLASGRGLHDHCVEQRGLVVEHPEDGAFGDAGRLGDLAGGDRRPCSRNRGRVAATIADRRSSSGSAAARPRPCTWVTGPRYS